MLTVLPVLTALSLSNVPNEDYSDEPLSVTVYAFWGLAHPADHADALQRMKDPQHMTENFPLAECLPSMNVVEASAREITTLHKKGKMNTTTTQHNKQ